MTTVRTVPSQSASASFAATSINNAVDNALRRSGRSSVNSFTVVDGRSTIKWVMSRKSGSPPSLAKASLYTLCLSVELVASRSDITTEVRKA